MIIKLSCIYVMYLIMYVSCYEQAECLAIISSMLVRTVILL